MFGDNIWSQQDPFQNQNLEQLQNQYRTQLETISRMQQAQCQSNILGEISRELGSLGKDELGILYDSQEYINSKKIYESGLLQYISSKFAPEYLESPSGREAGMALLKTIRESKDKIAYQSKMKNEKINQLLSMLETDPEMKSRYDILTGVKKEDNK